MKKDKLANKIKAIDQFEFHISPITLKFSQKKPYSCYLYFEKGAQVLGKIEESIEQNVFAYQFKKQHIKTFRIANDKNLIYQWSLYRETQNNEQEYIESATFNLKDFFSQYTQELDKIENQLYKIYSQRQRKVELEEIWKDLRLDFTKNQNLISSRLPKTNILVNFKIKIYCEYDFSFSKWQQQREKARSLKPLNSLRKSSIDSKNSRSRTSQIISSVSAKQPNRQKVENNSKTDSLYTEKQKRSQKQNKQKEWQNLKQSQTKITTPQEVNSTTEIPQKFLHHTKGIEEDFYNRKRTSMLSDIIEQSYEGSSNFNITKSNQGQRLKSIDIIEEQEEPIFSPTIKTQTFESLKPQAQFNLIKRTATLIQKHSLEFQEQQTPKTSTKGSQHGRKTDFDTFLNAAQKHKENILISETSKKRHQQSSCSETQQQMNQNVEDLNQAKTKLVRNAIKVLIIALVLVALVYAFASKKDSFPQKKGRKF